MLGEGIDLIRSEDNIHGVIMVILSRCAVEMLKVEDEPE